MAEARGLFGSASQATAKKSAKNAKAKKQERPPSPTHKPKKKAKHIEVLKYLILFNVNFT